MSDFIGKTISLTSNNDVRYFGTLANINSQESTVSLANVWSYGTEGRRGGKNEIPPSQQMFPSIVFKGSDVKDLKVMQDAPPMQNPYGYGFGQPQFPGQMPMHGYPGQGPAGQAPADPAAPSGQAPSGQAASGQAPSGPQGQAPRGPQGSAPSAPRQSQPSSKPKVQEHKQKQPASAPRPSSDAGRSGPSNPLEEYDFAASTKKLHEAEEKEGRLEVEHTYNSKSSFFDTLSSGNEGPEGRAQERGLNMETFGQPGNFNTRGRSRGRGGRGRGGRRGRGGGNGQGERQGERPN